uniref:uncharacterized protein isoform X1 n=1 Tax=Myxine glutinosa TaxID=7769 RepID=UPI00358E209D
MPICGVFRCSNRPGVRPGVKFYKTPKLLLNQGEETRNLSEERRRLWKAAINRSDIQTESQWDRTLVCSEHFVNNEKCYLHLKTNPSWLPTLQLDYTKCGQDTPASGRYDRARGHKRKRQEADAVSSLLSLNRRQQCSVGEAASASESPDLEQPAVSVMIDNEGSTSSLDTIESAHQLVQTDLTSYAISQLESDNKARLVEAEDMVKQRNNNFDRCTYVASPDKVLLYTGLPNIELLDVVYEMVEHQLPNMQKISKYQQLLLCLIKLRMNYVFQDIAYQLNISLSTAQRVFHATLDVLYVRLEFCVRWPDRENLRKSMPMCFRRTFGDRVSVIIDCFELFTEKPSGALNQVYTYSNYKQHHTVKYLIGISPQGTVIFISAGWGGRTSDKHIVQKSGFLQNLLPGDIVLADRGFKIADDIAFYQAKLVIPDFKGGKNQLHPMEV